MTGAAWLVALALVAPGCTRHLETRVTEEEPPRLATIVQVADPGTASQLLRGFYQVEHDSWRWTAEKFSVKLRPPHQASRGGATLQLKFSVPDVVIAKLRTVSLDAAVSGTALGRETYKQAGEFIYSRDIPGNLLAQDPVQIDFWLDKALPATPGDKRNLGIIVSSVGFEPK